MKEIIEKNTSQILHNTICPICISPMTVETIVKDTNTFIVFKIMYPNEKKKPIVKIKNLSDKVNFNNKNYKFCAMIEHLGDDTSVHTYAAWLNINSKWLKIQDENVTSFDRWITNTCEPKISGTAYLLFFKKCND